MSAITDREEKMNGITTLVARIRGGADARGPLARVLALALLMALVLPLLMTVFAPTAHAEEERDNYSLYNLSSNAANYFNKENSPDNDNAPDERMTETWREITGNPATGGDMLGYADPEFNLFNVVGWLYAEATGSTQTIKYDSLRVSGGNGANVYSGMLDYAHFGAANADLGLDTMSTGVGGQILSLIGGGIMLILYSLALLVSTCFWLVIQLLKVVNPFMWFYQAVKVTADSGGSTSSSHQQELAEGMTGGDSGGGALAGLQHWIAGWYSLLQSIAWEALVPLFIAFLLIGLVLFKKMDRGSAIKKLVIRVVFIGVGLPLMGSMYTGVLDKFDDSVWGSQAGPTRVVLSTYVDFDAWMMNDRLAVPEGAVVAWNGDQASNDAMMGVRTSALAINRQAHGSLFSSINVGTKPGDAGSAWRDGSASYGRPDGCTIGADGKESAQCNVDQDAAAIGATYGMLGRYIVGEKASASDFESSIKSSIMALVVDSDVKKEWFIDKASYGDSERFGDEGDYIPTNHPILAVNGPGLTSSNPGGDSKVFTSLGTKHGCGLRVWENDAPVSCNMSAMSAYNYLNTGFDASSMTLFSSNNVTSGLTREDHMAVSQVGTGPAKFMYWSNAATVLGSLVLLGFWYAIGMLAGAIKRTFSLVAAIPFATIGALAAISKVIVYSIALVLEVLVTLFIYQFVSELLISIPDIIAGPVSALMAKDGIWGSGMLGGIIVVVLTLISSLLVMGVTVALLRVRKVVLQAMDEVFTKIVDKFLETNTAPKPDKSGLLPSLAAGAGAGAGMAMGNKLASGVGSKLGGSKSPTSGGNPGGGKTASTNAGGLNSDHQALPAGKGGLALDGGNDPDSPSSGGGDDGPRPLPSGGGGDVRALPSSSGSDGPAGSKGSDGGDKGGPLQLTSGNPGSSRSDKETAQSLSGKGGLSNLGYSTGSQQGSRGSAEGQSGRPGAGQGQGGTGQAGTGGQGAQRASSRGGEVTGGQTSFGLGGGVVQRAPGTKQSGQSTGEGNGRNGGIQAASENAMRTSGGRTNGADQTGPTQFGSGPQGGASASSNPAQHGSKGARFSAGTSGPAQLNPGRAGTPANQAAPGTPGAAGTASTKAPQAASGTRSVSPVQGSTVQGQANQVAQPIQAMGGRRAAGRSDVQQPDAKRPQPQAPSSAPAPAPRQDGGRKVASTTAVRPQQGQRREQADRSVASGAAPQPSALVSAPAGNPRKIPTVNSRQARNAGAPRTPAQVEAQPQQQSPARSRRAADRAPKRTDGPVAQRESDESKD
ncbi:hypothetical protein [Pseudarthrobacter sp. GA104]|uniref:hypothetical protein n=1 Tax=Pseudarthrobacter sp. GA104 TaxID=2676311 RepID=UPI0012FC9C5D|nr:hypothetical protein [Pseudarthrobacter sp. GA104]MUU73389.1 hypothetical protein [Pseudarthrobacter sp. GA104]